MQKKIIIKSAKLVALKEGGHCLEVNSTVIQPWGDKGSGKIEHTAPVHPDLFTRMQQLGGHYAVMIDHIDELEFSQPQPETAKKLEDIFVSGFAIGGSDKAPNVVITGHYKNYRGKAVIANTPVESLVETNNSYSNLKHLNTALELLDAEVKLYVTGEKLGEAPKKTEEGPLKQPELQMEGNTYPGGIDNASPEAMGRVKADDDAQLPKEKEKEKVAARKKKLPQTPENPGGGEENV